MTQEEFIKKWNVAFESKEQELEFAYEMIGDLNKVNSQSSKIGFLGVIQRIIGFPFFAGVSLVALVFVWIKWLVNYVRFGGESIAYTERRRRKTILDVYERVEDAL